MKRPPRSSARPRNLARDLGYLFAVPHADVARQPFTDQLGLAAAAYLARLKGAVNGQATVSARKYSAARTRAEAQRFDLHEGVCPTVACTSLWVRGSSGAPARRAERPNLPRRGLVYSWSTGFCGAPIAPRQLRASRVAGAIGCRRPWTRLPLHGGGSDESSRVDVATGEQAQECRRGVRVRPGRS